MYTKMLIAGIGVLPFAVHGMMGLPSSQSEQTSRAIAREEPFEVVTQITTTSVVPPFPASADSSDCDVGWHDWSLGTSTSTSTSTLTLTVTALPQSAEPEATTGTASPSTSITQTFDVPSETSSLAASASLTSFSLSFASMSSYPAQTISFPFGPNQNVTEAAHNETGGSKYFGINVVNQKPYNPMDRSQTAAFKTSEDWETAFALLKANFPLINAIRMYSTTDGNVTHLMNAMPAARKHELMILVGVWSGSEERFAVEKEALENVIVDYGCDNIAAISVGNEDLNSINVNNPGATDEVKDPLKNSTAYMLIDQIEHVRNMTRVIGCPEVPVTHTDTWNEFTNTSKPWIPELINACDVAAIVNIFPYWSESPIETAHVDLMSQFNYSRDSMKEYGREVWLGETGWAKSQPNNMAPYQTYGTNVSDAQQYFDQVGCPVLSGDYGSAFYYVDWDEDAPMNDDPAFGLFNFEGKSIINLAACTASQLKSTA